MLPLLIDAAKTKETIFWEQTYGSRDSLMQRVSDPRHSPVHRCEPRTVGSSRRQRGIRDEIGSRPAGANFYPRVMTKGAFEAVLARSTKVQQDSLRNLYTLVRRGPDRSSMSIPYHGHSARSPRSR